MNLFQDHARRHCGSQQASLALLFLAGVIVLFSVGVQAQIELEDTQTSSQDFAPVGIIHVVTSAVQTESASVDSVLVPAVEAAIGGGVPPGNIVSLTRFAMKLGLSVEELAAAVDRLSELIAEGMSPGQALNQVKAELESPQAEPEENSEVSTASSNGNAGNSGNSGNNGNQGNNGNGPPEDKGPKDKGKKK